MQVFFSILSSPLFWVFLSITVLGYYLVVIAEKQSKRKKEKNSVESKRVSSDSQAINSNLHSPEISSLPKETKVVDEDNRSTGNRTVVSPESSLINHQTQLIEWAIQSSQKVEFDYENHYGAKSHRIVTPIRFMTFKGAFCLEGYCHFRKAKRSFALKRIEGIKIVSTGETSYQQESPQSVFKDSLEIDTKTSQTKNLKRPYIQHQTARLIEISESEWNNPVVLKDIHYELGFRSRKQSKDLREKISKRLNALKDDEFAWPSTTVGSGSQSMSSDAFKHEGGLLRNYGYKVGIHGLAQNERLRILDNIFTLQITRIDDSVYLKEWGEPNSARRLQKLAESIAAFTRNAKRHNIKDFSKAIEEWEADLAYLKRTYYDERFSFKWPRT